MTVCSPGFSSSLYTIAVLQQLRHNFLSSGPRLIHACASLNFEIWTLLRFLQENQRERTAWDMAAATRAGSLRLILALSRLEAQCALVRYDLALEAGIIDWYAAVLPDDPAYLAHGWWHDGLDTGFVPAPTPWSPNCVDFDLDARSADPLAGPLPYDL